MLGKIRGTTAYLRRFAHERPAIFYSLAFGAIGPVGFFLVRPIRRDYMDYKPRPLLPTSYPLPERARDANLTGYDD